MREYINIRNFLVLLLIIGVVLGSVYLGGKFFIRDRTVSGDTNINFKQVVKLVNKEAKNRFNEIIDSYGGKSKAETFFQSNGTSSEEVLNNLKDEILRKELMDKFRNEIEVSEEEIDLYIVKNDHLLPQQNVKIYQSTSKETLEPILEKLKIGEDISSITSNEDIQVSELDLGMNWDLIWNETKYLQAGQWTDIFVNKEVYKYEVMPIEENTEENSSTDVYNTTENQDNSLPEAIEESIKEEPNPVEVIDEHETWYIVQILHLYSLDEKKELVIDRYKNEQAYYKLQETLIELQNKE